MTITTISRRILILIFMTFYIFRSATSSARSSLLTEGSDKKQPDLQFGAPDPGSHNDLQGGTHDQSSNQSNLKFPFHGLFRNPWTRQHQEQKNLDEHVNSNPRLDIVLVSFLPFFVPIFVIICGFDHEFNSA